jgi:hypothetical protein
MNEHNFFWQLEGRECKEPILLPEVQPHVFVIRASLPRVFNVPPNSLKFSLVPYVQADILERGRSQYEGCGFAFHYQ